MKKKAELISSIADKSGLSQADAKAALNALVDLVIEDLSEGDSIRFEFGTWSVEHRKARTGHNPQKPGEKIQIPAKNVVKFKASATLNRAVNN